ncbi:hypothetical protein SASPL_148003 [Salvia splendens]|uniref:MULE transposase domain-containing protein n=1 Tax=Salvia splendens TaxID=180675 RepID=A0A8X8W9Z6_SALSN|nr:hypothetical protein SASPL_148003 [Salvia splendens]
MMQMSEQSLSVESNANGDAALPLSVVSNPNANALVVGKEFADVDTCRRTLKDTAIALHFEIRIVKSDRRVQNLHHQQASVGWVARSVEARIKDNPKYKPKEILQDIRDQHGIAVSYMQAWCGKERSMAALHGTYEEGFKLLPAYCELIRKTNPRSIASVLDRVHLKGKYIGTLLCAAAVDADDHLFPLAIAVVDVESDENWMWFVSELRKLLGVNTDSISRLTILSERTPGLVEAFETHFPNAFNGFCLRFVSENFRDTFKNSKLVNIFWSVAYALTTTEFESKISEMVQISEEVVPWLHYFNPQLWAVTYLEGVRYGHFMLNFTEILYIWALECHELPIVETMEHIRHQMASWFHQRLNVGMQLASILVPSAEKRISEAISDASCYKVLRANEVEFEIVSSERTNIVDVRIRICSCRRWQLYTRPQP